MPPHTPADSIPAIGYIRVSMLKEEQISPEIQRTAITDWARRSNRRIVRWVEDLDVSGRHFHRKIMEAIEAVESGEAREIAVWKYSRFGRNRSGNAVNLGRVNMAGGELQSATEEVDADTAIGKLARGVLMEFAAFESDRAGEQWVEAHENRRGRGLPSHGRPRFGYVLRGRMRDPLQPHHTIRNPQDGVERYEVDPETGPILAELYRRYIAGDGSQKLTAWLNTLGVHGTRNQAWSDGVLLRMLDAGFGAGLLRVHNPDCRCTSAGKCRNKILIPGAHEPVITEPEWQAYRRRRVRVAQTPPRARGSIYPLSGRLRCGHCGAAMIVFAKEDGQLGYWYRCGAWRHKRQCEPRSVRRHIIEAAVLQALGEWVEEIEANAPIKAPRPLQDAPDMGSVQREIEATDRALERLTMQLARELVDEDMYVRTRNQLLADRAKASARLEELEQPAPRERYEYVAVIRALISEWPTLPVAVRRELVAEVLPTIRVFRTDRRTAWIVLDAAWGEERRVDL